MDKVGRPRMEFTLCDTTERDAVYRDSTGNAVMGEKVPERIHGFVKVEQDDLALLIGVEGYGDNAHPILLELYQGELRLLVWGDINYSDPTQIIDLKHAREDARLLQIPDSGLTEGDLKTYIGHKGVRCIGCHGTDLRCGPPEIFDDGVRRAVHCNKCDREWFDKFSLTGVSGEATIR